MNISKLLIELDSKELLNIELKVKDSLALVGQSGSGKSLTLKAILGVLPATMSVELTYSSLDSLSKKYIGFVPQNPFTALSPLTKVSRHFRVSLQQQKELFSLVGLDEELLERFPPELSGGQLQRVIIALALEYKPKLLLLDEPTTALDPKTKVHIIELLKALHVEMKFKMLFVTHDIESVVELCKDIVILKDGIVVESATMLEVVNNPKSPYTRKLIEANFSNRKFRE